MGLSSVHGRRTKLKFADHQRHRWLHEAGEAVEHQRTGDSNVEACSLADHRDLDDVVDERPRLLRYATMFVTEEDDRSLPRWLESGERHRVLGQLDGDHDASPLAFSLDPGQLRSVEPVDVRPPLECVAACERPPVVLAGRDRHARTDGVACPQQRPEVRLVSDPERGGDEVAPATMLATPAGSP